jgi:ABC-2 type transport system permease protein
MIAVEFSKQLRRSRTWILVGICLAIALLVSIVFGQNAFSGPGSGGPDGLNLSVTNSGLVLGITALFFASHLLTPITFLVYFGEPMASEARWGSLRYLLVRPVGRSTVLSAKLVVSAVLAVGSLAVIPLVATIVGIGYFGLHPLVGGGYAGSSGGGTGSAAASISVGTTIEHLLLATGYVALDSAALAGLAVLIAVVTENVLAAVTSAAGVYVASAIVGALPGHFVQNIAPALPTHYFDAWVQLFQPGAPLGVMVHGVITQVAWLAITLVAAYVLFNRKDVKS